MNHKHIQVILEDHDYAGMYDTWDVINDLINYAECVELNCVDQLAKITHWLS